MNMHMHLGHGHGHAPPTWTCTMDLDMHHGHGHAPWTCTVVHAEWTWTEDYYWTGVIGHDYVEVRKYVYIDIVARHH
jgi:hypothetical protein